MNAVVKGSCLLGMGILVVFSGQPASAAEGPLLVVVEAPPALDADAAEIRRAIGVELRSQTIAPMKRSADPPERALIVAFDRDRIAMSLRTNDSMPVVRDIPAPTDRAARTRAIAWLAGNLARDQVTPIVAEPESSKQRHFRRRFRQSRHGKPRHRAAAAARSSIEPPRFEVPAATVTTHVDPERAHRSSWTIGAADGPTTITVLAAIDLRVLGREQHRSRYGTPRLVSRINGASPHQWLSMVGRPRVGGTTGFALEIVGASGLRRLGTSPRPMEFRSHRLGAGIEVSKRLDVSLLSTRNENGGFSTSVTTQNLFRAGLFAAVDRGVAHPLFESLDASFASTLTCRPRASTTGSSPRRSASGTTCCEAFALED